MVEWTYLDETDAKTEGPSVIPWVFEVEGNPYYERRLSGHPLTDGTGPYYASLTDARSHRDWWYEFGMTLFGDGGGNFLTVSERLDRMYETNFWERHPYVVDRHMAFRPFEVAFDDPDEAKRAFMGVLGGNVSITSLRKRRIHDDEGHSSPWTEGDAMETNAVPVARETDTPDEGTYDMILAYRRENLSFPTDRGDE